jgi:hypothetical protein
VVRAKKKLQSLQALREEEKSIRRFSPDSAREAIPHGGIAWKNQVVGAETQESMPMRKGSSIMVKGLPAESSKEGS